MSSNIASGVSSSHSAPADRHASSDFVTMVVAGQLFGIPVLSVQDVLGPQRITRIPLAPPEVAGALNLRGRIVTAIDMRRRLGLAAREMTSSSMSIVVDKAGELYSLSIDSVGEVLSLAAEAHEPTPPTLDPHWRDVATGIYLLEGRLMVVLDVDRLLDIRRAEAA